MATRIKRLFSHDQAVDGYHRHGLVREHLIPFGEQRVGSDGDTLALIALGDELEEHRCLGLVPLGIAEVVEHEQVESAELGQLGGQPQISACCLQALHQFAGAAEQHLVTPLDEGVADAGHQVRLVGSWRAEGQQVVALRDPAVGFGQRHDMGLGDGGHGREVELAEALARRQLAVGACARQSPGLALGHLVLQQRTQEALRGPQFRQLADLLAGRYCRRCANLRTQSGGNASCTPRHKFAGR